MNKFQDHINTYTAVNIFDESLLQFYTTFIDSCTERITATHVHNLFHTLSYEINYPMDLADQRKQVNNFILRSQYMNTFSPQTCILLYKELYGDSLGIVNQICTRSSKASFYNHILHSQLCRSDHGLCVSAFCMPEDGTD